MFDVLSGLGLAAKVVVSFQKFQKEQAALDAATDYLVSKYHLTPVERVTYGIPSQYGTSEDAYICDSTWEVALANLIHVVTSARSPTREVMIACGDIGLFVLVLSGKERHRQERDDRAGLRLWGGKPRPSWEVASLGDTETWKSLMEMGRGRGSDLALELIRQELNQWLGGSGLKTLRERVESLRNA